MFDDDDEDYGYCEICEEDTTYEELDHFEGLCERCFYEDDI